MTIDILPTPNVTPLPVETRPTETRPTESTPSGTVTQGHLNRAQSVELGRRRRGRNIAMLLSLLALSALFYAIAIVKLSGH